MNDRSLNDNIAAATVAVLLILTAWGNAIVLFVVSLIALVAWSLVLPKGFLRRGALPATLAASVAVVVALVMLFR